MKGVVFNLLETVIVDAHGIDAWEDLLDDTGLDGVYSAVGQYDDDDLQRLVAAGADKLGVDQHRLTRWFGEQAMPHLARTYPAFFENCPDTRSFLMSLNSVIHAEVKKLMPDAYLPQFLYEECSSGALLMTYRSDRKLCMFGEGLVVGAAHEYDETVSVSQSECVFFGAEQCRFVVDFG